MNNQIADSQIVSVRPSACPGLLRIAPALDGGICRIKLPCGRLTAIRAETIAGVAERYASGVIEITNRANLQLRGVAPATADKLIEDLLAAGLGPQGGRGGDDVRNLLASPTLGIDVDAALDVEPLALQILDALQKQKRFHQLSPKFALSLDGGERTAMLEHPHDIWLSAMPNSDSLLAFGLAGCPPVAPGAAPALAAVTSEHALSLVEAALQLFLELARPEQTRMRHLLNDISAAEFLRQLQQRVSFSLLTDATIQQWRRVAALPYMHIGIHPQRQPHLRYVGAAPVLGRIDALQLRGLAQLAHEYGDAVLRFTPFQSVLLANIPAAATPLVATAMQSLGLSCDAAAVLTRTVACTGSSGCVRGAADTKSDALIFAAALARLLPDRAIPAVHLSGCERSCAAAHIAPFTLLAVAPGYYNVFQRETAVAGFGLLLAAQLSVEAAAELLAGLFSKLPLSVEQH
ncbi:MAG TPA: precorrin-3B synthase [Spongiibacteraceae bacterium]|nr:precorrin-3B synthase [Spongiibacteraceae bacterium]